MSLMFADTRDHALTALVIKEAHQASAQGGGFVGRTAVQKIMYFLKALGVPMNYKFRLHHYGPYSDDLRDDVDCLLADDVIEDTSTDQERYSNFQTSTECEGLLDSYLSKFAEHKDVIASISHYLAQFQPDELELIMTLDFLYRVERAKVPKGDIKETVLGRFMDLKGNKPRKTVTLDKETVSDWYDKMIELELFE